MQIKHQKGIPYANEASKSVFIQMNHKKVFPYANETFKIFVLC